MYMSRWELERCVKLRTGVFACVHPSVGKCMCVSLTPIPTILTLLCYLLYQHFCYDLVTCNLVIHVSVRVGCCC